MDEKYHASASCVCVLLCGGFVAAAASDVVGILALLVVK